MSKFLTFFLLSIPTYCQVIITEVLYDLVGSDSPNEFVEIFNFSETDTIDLSGWKIRDKYSTDTIEDSGYGRKIPPRNYALIFEGDYNFEEGLYNNSIPYGICIMKVDDFSIGNGLSSSDSLYLINSDNIIEDSVGWLDVAPDGYSIEKVRLHLANILSNWQVSRDSLGTPGKPNSVLPFSVDGLLIADSLITNPSVIKPNELTMLRGTVTNVGLSPFSAQVNIKENGISINSVSIPELTELDAYNFSIWLGPFSSGIHRIDISLAVSGDQDSTNNSGMSMISVRYERGWVMINEFLPQPAGGQPEFVELFHNGTETLDMTGWRVTDNNTGLHYALPTAFLEPGDFVIVAEDSSLITRVPANVPYLVPTGGFPGLNNSGDDIRLFDPFSTLIDSLYYTLNWRYASGISMEKILTHYASEDSSSWKPSQDPEGITPGFQNSITPLDLDGAIFPNSIKHEPLYPLPEQNVTLFIPVINAGLTQLSGTIIVKENNETITYLPLPVISVTDTTVVNIGIPPLVSGVHPVSILLNIPGDLNPDNNLVIDTVKVSYPYGTVVINEFFPQPDSTQNEFIELFSAAELEMIDWAISDNTRKRRIFPSLILNPGDFIVIGADSGIIASMPQEAYFFVPNTGFPALNNTTDGIYLYDMTGFIVDSLVYSKEWPITRARATEKFRPEFNSNDSSRWGIAVNPGAMTPGKQNSIYYEELTKNGTVIYEPNPFSPDNDGYEDILNLKYKLPFEQAILKVEIFDVIGRLIAAPYWNVYVAQEGVLTWNGKRTNGNPARIGIYIVKVTAKNPANGKMWENIDTVVLARKL